ncbi:FAD-dependent oxidoreductase [Nonomuraea diastatica]|uniref:FAD-dependent oxidoreductase n=1 Tax=Nonomuraea diastatica TaxID=1848329 RepID=UPI001C707394|nr:NAD(P)/FAD-dependent oxidoreductase [Nonomuraea diastatica]
MTPHIAIIGGGIGGLCLAQGLRKAGLDVTVHERDRTPADRLQGYRVHIDPHGARALHACLPAHLWEAFLGTTGRGGQDFGFLTERLNLLALLETPKAGDPADDHHSVSRITLRQVLLSGLDDVVRFGKTYERYEKLPNGRIRLFFADGTSEDADIVVAADGGNSRVREQHLPHAKRVNTGIITVAGKFPLTDATRKRLAPRLADGPNTFIPPRGMGLFTAPHDLGEPVTYGGIGATEQEDALMDNTSSYILWAFGATAGRFPTNISEMSGAQLKDTVAGMISSWHPDLRRLVGMTDPDTVTLLPIRTSIPIDPWPASTITFIGDAIHSMTPMRGIGANTALRDARLLCGELTGALTEARANGLTGGLSGGGDAVAAIARYETRMREYGFAAVRDSLRSAEQFIGDSRVARMGFKSFLRLVQRLPSLKAKVFS